jgi:DNA-binding NtrC family response regulator
MSTRGTLLVVEDDDAMRELLAEELGDAGYTVRSAPSASIGIELARAEPADVVVTDLRMPEMDGFDLIRGVRALPAPPHIIMVTAFGSIETAIRAVKLGAYDYITKPFEIEELLLAVDKALAERGLRRQVERLQAEVEDRFAWSNIVAHSAAMQDVISMVRRVAGASASVLVTGESGTGKELIARAIHYNSPRRAGPFVAINLAAVPAALIESELFGHKKGAFTDARADKPGVFVEASGGTIFLDEIGELALPLQAKLLRVLQEQEVRPLGASKNQSVDVRVVAATNRHLEGMLGDGSFREDLYYRLNVIQIELPPLRARPEDIGPLSEYLLRQLGARQQPPRQVRLSPAAREALLGHRWPGNVRELTNVLERGLTLCAGDEIGLDDLPAQVRERKQPETLAAAAARRLTLAELEREYIGLVLDDEGGNKTRAAQRLGLDRKTLYRKLDEYARSSAQMAAEPDGDPDGGADS